MSRTDAPPQLERVLAMIPWLATHRDVPKAEVAQRFRVSVEQLNAVLRQHLSVVTSLVGDDPWRGK